MNGFKDEFLRGALDVAPDGVVICEVGGDRLVVYANPAFCRLTGYDLGELVGKNLRLLQGDGSRAAGAGRAARFTAALRAHARAAAQCAQGRLGVRQ